MPEDLRQNFFHLMMDIGGYGVLNATALTFLNIYATRIHAGTEQIGILNAIPALMTMLLSLPAGPYLEKRSLTKTSIVLGILHRSYYMLLVLLPFILNEKLQVNLLIALTFIMYIPYSAFALAFNSLFSAAVPPEWRGYFAGARNALFAVVTILMALLSGYLLEVLPFPIGYQVVFGLGFIGAMVSTYHIARIRVPENVRANSIEANRGRERLSLIDQVRKSLRIDILHGPFLRVLILLTIFHFCHYLPSSIFPVFMVNNLHLTDQTISVGTSLFYVTMFIGSLQHSRIVNRFGNRWVVGIGMVLMATYPATLSLATGPALYLVANILGGFAWSLCGTALFNYLLESVPVESRPSYLAWFSVLANFGVLAGSLLGPVVSNSVGIVTALVLAAVLRAASGAVILRWG
ncbi:arabinose efflux permease [Longilinea arvoryzae]|uniref:Arabinose efflux permease n=2 Tax=Longilinea arvoryzae TaxID=360412 RepID=A0A0S7BAP6_9CHLR|nr:arabinose efflux permease [Longilinea arvoryzae]